MYTIILVHRRSHGVQLIRHSKQLYYLRMQDMRTVFETSRNEWMNGEEADWLTYAQPYPNIKETLQYCEVLHRPLFSPSTPLMHQLWCCCSTKANCLDTT